MWAKTETVLTATGVQHIMLRPATEKVKNFILV